MCDASVLSSSRSLISRVNERLLLCRDDQSEGGEGGPVVQRVCREKEVGTGEVRSEKNGFVFIIFYIYLLL